MALSRIFKVNITGEVFLALHASGHLLFLALIPQFLQYQSCLQISNATICNDLSSWPEKQKTSQEEASLWLSMVYFALLLPACFVLMIWGPLVDRVGQHRAMRLPPALLGLQSILFMTCAYYPHSSRVYDVAIAALSIFHGGAPGVLVLAFSYVASISKPKNRGKRMTIMQCMLITSDMIAGLVSGFVLQAMGYIFAFGCITLLSAINLLFVIFLAKPIVHAADPETNDIKPKPICSYLNPLKGYAQAFRLVYRSQYRNNYLFIMAASFFAFFTGRGAKYITVLFVTYAPFNFRPVLVGYFLGYVAAITGLGSVVSNQILTKLFQSDFVLLFTGMCLMTIQMILTALSNSTLMLFLVNLLGAVSFLALPVLRGMMTKLADVRDAGTALSVLETVTAICSVAASVSATNVYRKTLGINPGIVFFFLSISSFISLLIITVMYILLKRGWLLSPSRQAEVSNAMLPVSQSVKADNEETANA